MNPVPNTVVESLACGTPAVAFDIGGMPDMIEHQINGYLAKLFDTSDLAAGIDWVLSDDKRHRDLCIKAREKAVTCFDIEKIARQYAELYGEVLG
jgi:glycosyltransferase involved in cell wall biosynthesis